MASFITRSIQKPQYQNKVGLDLEALVFILRKKGGLDGLDDGVALGGEELRERDT